MFWSTEGFGHRCGIDSSVWERLVHEKGEALTAVPRAIGLPAVRHDQVMEIGNDGTHLNRAFGLEGHDRSSPVVTNTVREVACCKEIVECDDWLHRFWRGELIPNLQRKCDDEQGCKRADHDLRPTLWQRSRVG